MKKIKRYFGIILFIGIEAYYFYRGPADLEVFFMVWIFIALTIFLFNIFNIRSLTFSSRRYTRAVNLQTLGTKENEEIMNQSRFRRFGEFNDGVNIVFLLMAVINVGLYFLLTT